MSVEGPENNAVSKDCGADAAAVTAEDTVRAIEAAMPMLKRYAWALSRSGDMADDLVQDTVERALSNLHNFEHGTNVQAWLFTILRNAFRTKIKRNWSESCDPETLDSFLAPVLPAQQHGLELEDLERAIDALPEDMREAVLLVGLEGLSYNDAAVSLGIKTGTLKSRLSRSRDLLRRIFEGHADRSAETPPPPGQARLKPRGTARPSLRALPVAPQVLRKALGIRRSLSD